ncbi:hypothetical protein [Polymorphobacter fuscus]|uniref:Uncharacterized protein n=1 Tax=Sandarakinorhabdus fusca TaxID=1439888 RepID=A0A7C9GPB7_9SPHN|nr:hypothetical protein [Polymorphobacter fuscus]KAB7646224.1 hypothetical protein F9290_09190 [Polymorphobacter fuscus]MQT17435.1 hypothetical protein [Polymorphobacter fuscus]NJC10028.1 hypothetical protein [Polymorphobacter fuscus]
MMPFLLLTLLMFAVVAIGVMLLATAGVVLFVRARLVSLAFAVLGGLGFSALIHGGAGAAILGTAALLVIFESMRKSAARRRRDRARYDVEATATPAPSRPTRRIRTPRGRVESPDPALDAAWEALAGNADWAVSRVAVARESCRLFLATVDRGAWDSDAGDLAVRIRRRVPEHVAECLDRCEIATPSERRAILDECVFTTEKVAAEADRQRARLLGPAHAEMNVQRRHLTRPAQEDPFSLD